jgi:DNA-binding MarR family transcriptional regulator
MSTGSSDPAARGQKRHQEQHRDLRRESLGYLTRYSHRALVKVLSQKLDRHRLLAAQWSVLRVLWRQEGLTQRLTQRLTQVELADAMRVEKASLTGLLNGMERAGLISRRRNPDDRRKINIRLTARGRRLEREVLPYAAEIDRQATRGLTAAETETLKALLARIITNLET